MLAAPFGVAGAQIFAGRTGVELEMLHALGGATARQDGAAEALPDRPRNVLASDRIAPSGPVEDGRDHMPRRGVVDEPGRLSGRRATPDVADHHDEVSALSYAGAPRDLTDRDLHFVSGAQIVDPATRGRPLAHRSRASERGFKAQGLAGLTKLSAYWMRLRIILERSRPGHPEDHGRHERMPRTLKSGTARPARGSLMQQQERLDEFNHERPHEALEMKRPVEVQERSPRPCPSSLPEPSYPEHDDALRVGSDGSISFARRQCYFAAALAGQHIGIREQRDGRWLVTFMSLDLGHLKPNGQFIPAAPSSPPEAN